MEACEAMQTNTTLRMLLANSARYAGSICFHRDECSIAHLVAVAAYRVRIPASGKMFYIWAVFRSRVFVFGVGGWRAAGAGF